MAALDLFVKALEHAARLLAGAARAFDGDVIAALLGDHAEPTLDQREVLPVLAEQDGSEPVVLEGEHGLRGRGFLRRGGGRDRGIRCAQGDAQAPAAASAGAPARSRCPRTSIGSELGDGDLDHGTDQRPRRHHLHRL